MHQPLPVFGGLFFQMHATATKEKHFSKQENVSLPQILHVGLREKIIVQTEGSISETETLFHPILSTEKWRLFDAEPCNLGANEAV